MSRPRKIAIIGAGVSGLTAAHLRRDRHDVTLYEAAARPGGHACTVDVPVPEGGAVVADVGDAFAAQLRHGEISGADRIHFAGAYWSSGFHEDGVASAYRVVAAIDTGPRDELLAA